MKLKQATQLAIIGVILQLIPFIWMLFQMIFFHYAYCSGYLNFISVIGTALLLPFFIILFKSQK
ncbi:MAG: hypothetical protein M0R21_02475 [Lentimicrobiaceae bacterium]|nr:hypothetical protein [Lentimicrobiaceae bacterium]